MMEQARSEGGLQGVNSPGPAFLRARDFLKYSKQFVPLKVKIFEKKISPAASLELTFNSTF